MFIANAAMNPDGNMSLMYLDEGLKSKFQVEEDYSLMVTELEMKDSSNFTCTVIKFQTDQRLVHDVIYTNVTYLLVQGQRTYIITKVQSFAPLTVSFNFNTQKKNIC